MDLEIQTVVLQIEIVEDIDSQIWRSRLQFKINILRNNFLFDTNALEIMNLNSRNNYVITTEWIWL